MASVCAVSALEAHCEALFSTLIVGTGPVTSGMGNARTTSHRVPRYPNQSCCTEHNFKVSVRAELCSIFHSGRFSKHTRSAFLKLTRRFTPHKEAGSNLTPRNDLLHLFGRFREIFSFSGGVSLYFGQTSVFVPRRSSTFNLEDAIFLWT